MNSQEAFHDKQGRLWFRGGSPPYVIADSKRENGFLVPLPFHDVPMWLENEPQTSEDCYYCVCVQCNQMTNQLCQIVLDFYPDSWCVRIICIRCRPDLLSHTSYHGFLLNVRDLVEPMIANACKRRDETCEICEKQGGCDNAEECATTRQLIGRTEVEDLMEYFYRIQLDVVSVLRFKVCHRADCSNAQVPDRLVSCKVCRRVAYCSERCKRLDQAWHETFCEEFYEIWRP